MCSYLVFLKGRDVLLPCFFLKGRDVLLPYLVFLKGRDVLLPYLVFLKGRDVLLPYLVFFLKGWDVLLPYLVFFEGLRCAPTLSCFFEGLRCAPTLSCFLKGSLTSDGEQKIFHHKRNSSINILLMWRHFRLQKRDAHPFKTDSKRRHSSSATFPFIEQLAESGRQNFLIHGS